VGAKIHVIESASSKPPVASASYRARVFVNSYSSVRECRYPGLQFKWAECGVWRCGNEKPAPFVALEFRISDIPQLRTQLRIVAL